ncbi:MAG: DNA/RNA nuclease SfsA [Oceanospirillaceae bacterium]|nr:DNA/RNA nuclease SfsA [Oceanospirillaceae bacterium]MBT10809.1 DNA/RNA nuclease SfsA [Oceanospirillaceae bacterium]|tara:strand:+ start:40221 stop:40934 length:714 start_codon:yes stop_codon:yes gene_type:complete
MKYDAPLVSGRLLRRYKRFLADIMLDDGREVTAHCPNTGSMKHCADPDSRVWLWDSHNPKRKYQLTWEWVEVDGCFRACVNTVRANQLVEEALQQGRIQELAGDYDIRREPRVDDGRLDFLLTGQQSGDIDTYIEVKSVTLLSESDAGLGSFPDAVTERGLKHLRRLQALKAAGHRALLLFCVPHEGIDRVQAAADIDPAYAAALAEVAASGVEVLAYRVSFSEWGMVLDTRLPVML